jgi:hypothetical protein
MNLNPINYYNPIIIHWSKFCNRLCTPRYWCLVGTHLLTFISVPSQKNVNCTAPGDMLQKITIKTFNMNSALNTTYLPNIQYATQWFVGITRDTWCKYYLSTKHSICHTTSVHFLMFHHLSKRQGGASTYYEKQICVIKLVLGCNYS